jgi:hypothetical protein
MVISKKDQRFLKNEIASGRERSGDEIQWDAMMRERKRGRRIVPKGLVG